MKLQVPFIQLPIVFDASALASEISMVGEEHWRPHPNGIPGNSALTLVTTHGNPDSDEMLGPMRATPVLDRLPYLTQVLDALGATWGRSRLMRLSGQAEVTPHVDINYYWRERMRVHVPIVTTPSVRFHCGEGEVNMAAGECWIFDTWRMHRVHNGGNEERIHLVADTVGGERFLDLMSKGRAPGRESPGWVPERVAPRAGFRPELGFESVNAPLVMTPWELREHMSFLFAEAIPAPQLAVLRQSVSVFARCWQALWARYGEAAEGFPHYRALLDSGWKDLLSKGLDQVGLQNGVPLVQALSACVFEMALGDRNTASAVSGQNRAGARAAASAVPARNDAVRAEFDRPVFIVSPPRSGSTLLFETLAGAPGVFTIGDESHQLIEGIPALAPGQSGHDSNRLLADNASLAVAESLRLRFHAALRDRDARPPASPANLRLLEKTPKNSLRIPFLKAVFPQARFIYLHRDPRQVLASMLEGWRSGRFVTYPRLAGWEGLPWSFLLTPNWRELVGQPLPDIVARQWDCTTRVLLDDLEALPREAWTAVDYGRFLDDPQGQVARLCDWAGYGWDRVLGKELPHSRYTTSAPDPEKWRRHAGEIEPRLLQLRATMDRAARVAGT